MATKPTERIPDWASTGTVADPGTSKEAAGWLTSERMPAGWLNWIWNTFGKWVSYLEDITDENESGVVGNVLISNQLATKVPYAMGKLSTGSSPSWTWNRDGNFTSVFEAAGDWLIINLADSMADVDTAACFVSPTGTPVAMVGADFGSGGSQIVLQCKDFSGNFVNLNSTTIELVIGVWGEQ